MFAEDIKVEFNFETMKTENRLRKTLTHKMGLKSRFTNIKRN